MARSSLEQENVDPDRPDDDHLIQLTNAAIQRQEEVATLSPELENSDPNRPESDDRISVETLNVLARGEGRRDRWKRRVLCSKTKRS